jgi:hypothetical protein
MECQDGSNDREHPAECWYWVKASFKAVHVGAVRRRHLWQTIVFLIRGPRNYEVTPPASVKRKAEQVAKQKEHEYEAVGGHTVRWVFQHINAIAPLVDNEIGEGAEVYWEFYVRVDKEPTCG